MRVSHKEYIQYFIKKNAEKIILIGSRKWTHCSDEDKWQVIKGIKLHKILYNIIQMCAYEKFDMRRKLISCYEISKEGTHFFMLSFELNIS